MRQPLYLNTVRELRLKTGLSQEKLARELKIDRSNLASAQGRPGSLRLRLE
jgi:transcriptional regulator with XRE-family HTH domain